MFNSWVVINISHSSISDVVLYSQCVGCCCVVAVAGLLYVTAKEWIAKYLCILLLQQHLLQCCQLLRQLYFSWLSLCL